MRVELSCAVCGGNNLGLDEAETDSSEIACRDCGHEVGTFGQVKAIVLPELTQLRTRKSDRERRDDKDRNRS